MPGRAILTSCNDKINCDVWLKTSFCIWQLSSPSLDTDRCFSSNQFVFDAKNAKDPEWWRLLFLCSFLPALICMCVFTLRGFTWLLAWKYVTICNTTSLRAAMFFPIKKNISCTRSVCTEVSRHFHPNFHYTYIVNDKKKPNVISLIHPRCIKVGLQWCTVFIADFGLYAWYRLRKKPQHASLIATCYARASTKAKKYGRTLAILIHICPSVTVKYTI